MRSRPALTLTFLVIMTMSVTLVGCLGRQSSVLLDTKELRLQAGVVAVSLEVGDGSIVDFCVVLSDTLCGFAGGEAVSCDLDVPSGAVTVFCADPVLVQWPDTWNVTEATWSAPSVPASGQILVEPASNFLLGSGVQIITDPGFSAHVLRMDLASDFGPADIEISLAFDHGNALQGCVKGVEVMVAELQGFAFKVIIPLGDPVIDFPSMTSGADLICLDELVAAEPAPWPTKLALRPPNPNPSRGPVRLTVALPSEAVIDLAIHDVQGRLVRNVARGHFEPGYPELIWDGFDEAGRFVASGIYFARLVVNEKLVGMERVVILTD